MTHVTRHILNPIRLAAAALTLLVAAVACGDAITLKGRATATDTTVRLQDVATLEGAYAQSLGELKLAQLSDVGDRESIELIDVRRVLAKAGANWAKLIVRGATRVAVTRVPAPVVSIEKKAVVEVDAIPVAPIAMQTLGDQIEAWVHQRVGAVRGELQIEFGLGQESILALPLNDYEFQIDPVAVSRIGAQPEAVWNPAQLVGKQLTESVRMGETLSAHQVAAPRAVQRGGDHRRRHRDSERVGAAGRSSPARRRDVVDRPEGRRHGAQGQRVADGAAGDRTAQERRRADRRRAAADGDVGGNRRP
ncbi:MAG: hypothetical protein ACYTGQ_19915 [Planctomycetota bacterium]